LRDQDTSSVADMAFDKLVYKGHPYQQASDGYPDTVGALSAADLRGFHRHAFGPRQTILAIVGAVRARRALDAVEALFGDWSVKGQDETGDVPDARPLRKPARKNVTLAGKTQADLVVGTVGPRRSAEDYLAATLGNNVLGRFGLFGRIGDRVRQQEGLAYYSYSSVTGGTGPGPWKVSAGVNPANVDRAIELIQEEIKRFTGKKIDKDELTDNQANFIGRLPLQLESNGGVAGGLVYIERHQLGLDYYQKYPQSILAITREAVLEAARHYLDADRLAVAVAGPKLPGA
jgi:zinc protease